MAAEKNVPAYIIFGDKTLKDMAGIRPVSREEFSAVFGVGQAKLDQYSETFIKVIKEYLDSGVQREKIVKPKLGKKLGVKLGKKI